MTPVWQAFAEHFRWVVGVPGNHDLFGGGATMKNVEHLRKRLGVDILHGEIVQRDGLRIAGFGGIVGTNRRPWRSPPETFYKAISRLMTSEPDVLVLHEGPSGGGSDQPGNDEIRARVSADSQRGLVICGHSHWSRPHCHIHPNLDVLNVDSRCLVLKNRRP